MGSSHRMQGNYLGKRLHTHGQVTNAFLYDEAKPFHTLILGMTGSGKSTLMLNLMLEDLRQGNGFALIDPHGDLSDTLLTQIPQNRLSDVILFDPSDLERPIGLNILWDVPEAAQARTTAGLVAAFKSIWSDSWGPRLEYILSNSLAALIETGDATLLHLIRFLRDDRFRTRILKRVKDPLILGFFQDEFNRYPDRLKQEAIAPVLNKVGQLLLHKPMRNVLGQMRSLVSFSEVMQRNQVFIAKLSKGELGSGPAQLLGSFLSTQFELAALERSKLPANQRKLFCLYVDEVQNLTGESLAHILAEGRKYGLALTLATQTLETLDLTLKTALLANVGTIIAFKVSSQDADVLEKAYAGNTKSHQFVDVPRFEAWVRPKSLTGRDYPYRLKTEEPTLQAAANPDRVKQHSRMIFGRTREEIEAKIERWLK
ncbi:MAG: type IV secretion system DNA-binding domain-containing protein [Trueperaceae bacterium]|nr:type IV secretion system DNA-binding domain-containing protein [Trueperaceae bacterium]